MNTIMKGLSTCKFCGKTIRFLEVEYIRGTPGTIVKGWMAVEAAATDPDDVKFDAKKHIKHKNVCTGIAHVSSINVTYADGRKSEILNVKTPCKCQEKKA